MRSSPPGPTAPGLHPRSPCDGSGSGRLRSSSARPPRCSPAPRGSSSALRCAGRPGDRPPTCAGPCAVCAASPTVTVPVNGSSPASGTQEGRLCPLPAMPETPTISPRRAVNDTSVNPCPLSPSITSSRLLGGIGEALGRERRLQLAPDDEREELVVGDGVHVRAAADLAVAQHRDPIGELADLGEPVGDVDDRRAVLGRLADAVEEPVDRRPARAARSARRG